MPQQYELKQVRIYLKEATPLYSNEEIISPESAIRVMSEALAGMDREYCCVVNLDSRHRPINFNIVSIGDANSAIVPIQNVFKSAIASSAAGIILLHNHPSGVLEPSREDTIITEKLIYAGKLMDINIVDHVIVGGTEGKYYSFKEEADFLFEAPLKLGENIVADRKSMKDQLKEITDRLEAGIEDVFTSENYRAYLTTMAKFTKYSFNNTLLIALQNPDATLVAGYDAWKRKFHRHVKKGEKAIKIIAPMTFKGTQEVEKVDPVTQEIMLNARGEPETEKKEFSYQRFKVSNVFDYSQTEGEPVPTLEVPELSGNQKNFDVFMEAVKKVSPVPIRFDAVSGEAKGYYDNAAKEIVIRKGMSEIQTIKTAVHELGHSLCHDRDFLQAAGEKKDRVTMELGSDYLASHGIPVTGEGYRQVYRDSLDPGTGFEDIYKRFNLDRPDDFTGHSLSVGDVVVLSRNGSRQAGFVDIIGFKDLPDFRPGTDVEKTAVIRADKKAEEQMKQLKIRAIKEIKEAAVRL